MILTNAMILLPDQAFLGSLAVAGGLIGDVQPGHSAAAGALDCEGDFLLPGAIDVHTDNLERQVHPRPNARWPSLAALLAHDAQCVAAGITTVFDSLCVGDLGFDDDRNRTCAEGIADLAALPAWALKAEHLLHLRCELPAEGMPGLLASYAENPLVRLVSLMDHTPGAGQYGDVERYKAMRLRDGEDPADTLARIERLTAQRARLRAPNRQAALEICRAMARPPVIASHDDRSVEDITENQRDGIGICEFPVALEAAMAARAAGMGIIAGAPNLVRGGSHTGNVAVRELLAAGLVDAFASDYVPVSLLHAAFMAAAQGLVALPQAIAMVTSVPAAMARLADRGKLQTGLRADLVRVRLHHGVPVIRGVWCAGARVA